jgi:N-acetylglucosamine malate deacetylase 1
MATVLHCHKRLRPSISTWRFELIQELCFRSKATIWVRKHDARNSQPAHFLLATYLNKPHIMFNMTENILFICAHSDDHIFGAGGTIARYAKEGKHVHVIILSFGEKTHPWLKAHVTKNIRARETYHADDIVGCKSTFFDLKEGSFMKNYPSIKQDLLAVMGNEKPDKVFTHNDEDPHPDHKATYAITREIIKEAKLKPETYLFSIWNPFSLSKSHLPKMYVDITKTHSKKVQAIKHFKSQWAALTILVGGIFVRDIKNGLHIGTRFAERFYRLK